MNQNINIYNQSTSEVDGNYLQASQQLQIDKQTYGSDYIHLYVEDIEGDWLENLDWEDDLTDYVDAFYHHCEQQNYQFAFDTLIACNELLNQPENNQKLLELYNYLAESLKVKHPQLATLVENLYVKDPRRAELNEKILNILQAKIVQLDALPE
ncbi:MULTISPECIES: hypothetical protein [unclassified Anabaena]|uniref:hypothetical protein n=1 Tax=unclassified Anabaena TaxID=2619674 RepID=UPI0039C762F0